MAATTVTYDIRDAKPNIFLQQYLDRKYFCERPSCQGKKVLKIVQSFTREYNNVHKVCGLTEAAVA